MSTFKDLTDAYPYCGMGTGTLSPAMWYRNAEVRFVGACARRMSSPRYGIGYLAALEAQELSLDLGGIRKNIIVIATVKGNAFEIGVSLKDSKSMTFVYDLWHKAPGESCASPICLLHSRQEVMDTIEDIVSRQKFRVTGNAPVQARQGY